ncbi:hypothetical protein J1N35_002282 [Gossypium stocksii]|uniref:X8 domain-containing protein n=1 Tax=Gossypium stocksii TaxID=47602 RepID=A0A9D3WLU6_9ROSI|nr:hypothetical protein J1N35_002282 [Gossypium stocksii]
MVLNLCVHVVMWSADEHAADYELKADMDWACGGGGGGADCSKIQMNQPCYFPKTMLLMHSMITTQNSSTKVVLAI